MLGASDRVSLRTDATWKSTVYFTPFNDDIERQAPLGLLDLSAEFGPARPRWSISAYVRNLTDERYITDSHAPFLPAIGGRPGDPRLVGVQLSIRR